MSMQLLRHRRSSRACRRGSTLLARAAAVLALVLLVLVLAPSQALAKSYEMTQVDIDATVNTDGSLTVVEDRTFDFSGTYHYCYWDLSKSASEFSDLSIQVAEAVAGGEYETSFNLDSLM